MKIKEMRYITERPKTILQMAGCGRVKGPFGNAKTEMIRKKKATHVKPVLMFD